MKLTKVIINNFRSFGDSQDIGFNDQTVLIGNNSSGKTTVLQALSKLFSDKQNDRIIRKSDFHLPKGLRPGENSRTLFIETIFEFDELDGTAYSPAIPSFFEHFTVSQGDAKPFLRIRLESSWEDDGTVEGSIDTQIYYISSAEDIIKDEDKHRAPRKDLDKIRVLYVPASRTPEKELGNASGSMLSRLVNSINWTDDEIKEITNKIDELNNTFLSESGALTQINQEIQKSWKLYHEDKRFSQAELTINSSEMAGALRQIALKFSPTTTEEAFTVSELGDGLRSIFYFSLVDSILDIELKIIKDREENPVNPRFKLIPPILTILAIEEPENHIAPHHIGKLVKRFKQLSNNDNSQVVLTSHSPAIVKRIEPEDLRYLRIENNDRVLQTIVSGIQLPQAIDESYKYIKGAIQAYPELYFAKLVVLGEGDSEELLLPKFFDLLGKEIDNELQEIMAGQYGTNEEFFQQFSTVLSNTKTGNQKNQAVYDYLSNPVDASKIENVLTVASSSTSGETRQDDRTSLMLILIGYLISLAIAYLLQHSDIQGLQERFKLTQRLSWRNATGPVLFLSISSFLSGAILALVTGYKLDFSIGQTSLFIFLMTLIVINMTYGVNLLLAKLKSFGFLIGVALLLLYLSTATQLFDTYYVYSTKFLASFSPLNYLELMIRNYINQQGDLSISVSLLVALALGLTGVTVLLYRTVSKES
ncbi:ATP-dependent nuclease [Streptococcus suis]